MIKKILPFVLIMIATTAIAELVQFSAQTPTQREDNSPLGLSEIEGFHIHCGTVQGNYTGDVFIAGATLPETAWNIDLSIGTHYCVVTTQDIDGRLSQYSNEVTVVIEGKSRPNPPMIPPNTIIRKVVTLP